MSTPGQILTSSIGKKTLVAITGSCLILFVIGHMSGNLLVFAGSDAINDYAQFLHSHTKFLWSVRSAILTIFLIHLVIAIKLTRENRMARPVGYAKGNTVQASLASRTMAITGILIFFYLLYHLAHFTIGIAHHDLFAETDYKGRPNAYARLMNSFAHPEIAAVYIVAMFFLALHLSHGLPSIFQTMGWNSPRSQVVLGRLGLIFAIVIFTGYCSIPVCIWLKVIQ